MASAYNVLISSPPADFPLMVKPLTYHVLPTKIEFMSSSVSQETEKATMNMMAKRSSILTNQCFVLLVLRYFVMGFLMCLLTLNLQSYIFFIHTQNHSNTLCFYFSSLEIFLCVCDSLFGLVSIILKKDNCNLEIWDIIFTFA